PAQGFFRLALTGCAIDLPVKASLLPCLLAAAGDLRPLQNRGRKIRRQSERFADYTFCDSRLSPMMRTGPASLPSIRLLLNGTLALLVVAGPAFARARVCPGGHFLVAGRSLLASVGTGSTGIRLVDSTSSLAEIDIGCGSASVAVVDGRRRDRLHA